MKPLQKKLSIIENELNDQVRKHLDNKKMYHLAKILLFEKQKNVHALRDHFESLATLINIPTKTDIANLSQLAKQIEEKLDCLLEQLLCMFHNQSDMKKVSLPRKRVKKIWDQQVVNLNENTKKDMIKQLIKQWNLLSVSPFNKKEDEIE
jgi:hypothetical protein